VLRGFYAVILVNAAIVFASVERRALGVLLVVALGWTWRPTRAAAVAIRQVGSR
jgi:hypothetical protein